MGIFGSRKKTYVSSVVYNMAGDELDRPDYLKTIVLSSIINRRKSIADSIVGSYLEGPGMRFRKFAKWSRRTNYNDVIGFVSGTILTGDSIDTEVLITKLPITVGSIPNLQSAKIAEADYTFWTDQWISENHPEKLTTTYVSNYDESTNTITITWPDESTDSFTPINYDLAGTFLYAVFTELTGEEIKPVETGEVIVLDEEDDFPDITEWTEISYTEEENEIHGVWERSTYKGQASNRDATYTLKEIMYQDTVPEGDPVVLNRSYRIDTQITYHNTRSPMKVFIYKYGDGDAELDAMFAPKANAGSFFPFIPFRINNKFVSETYLPEVYTQAKKGYKKATTGRFDEMVKNLEDNESLKDIDYAYTVFGVSLNVLENASRKYVYRFFQEIMNDFPVSGTGYNAWQLAWNDAQASQEAWMQWSTAQADPENPLYGTIEPEKLPYPPMPSNSIRISSGSNPTMNYDMTISWSTIQETVGTGKLKSDAKRDELWFTIGATQHYEEVIWGEESGTYQPIPGNSFSNDDITLNWQVTPNTWRRLRIVGLKHRNLIYGGKSVDISAKEALEDVEESGFIIPLHEGIYRSMGLKDSTQMATACSFMVFNCYQVVKKKWYQTGIFMIILIIIIIVIAVYTAGAGAAASGGILGTNATVGAALGFAGTTALIVGAIANAVAAMILTKIITEASTAVFGEKWGAIIGAIASIIALQVGTAMASGQTMASSFSGLMKAENILKLTSAVGQGYQGYVQAASAEMAKEAETVMANYERESREIQQAWMQNIGTGRGVLNPLEITNAFGVTMESVNAFLQRTLMTGSEVADMSLSMLTNFVDITLSNELPT